MNTKHTIFFCMEARYYENDFAKKSRKRPLYPVNTYLFKVRNGNTRKRCKICSEVTIKTPERRRWRLGVFVVTFEHILHVFLVLSFVDFEQVNVNWVVSLNLLHPFLVLLCFNPFQGNIFFMYPLETSENQKFSDNFPTPTEIIW